VGRSNTRISAPTALPGFTHSRGRLFQAPQSIERLRPHQGDVQAPVVHVALEVGGDLARERLHGGPEVLQGLEALAQVGRLVRVPNVILDLAQGRVVLQTCNAAKGVPWARAKRERGGRAELCTFIADS
jgi:hypothetical protein